VTASSSPGPEPAPGGSRTPATETASATAAAPEHASTSGTATVDPSTTNPGRSGKHAAEPSVGQLVSDASAHLSNLVHSEIELAKLELRSTVKSGITGAGAFIAAAIVLVFALVYGFQAAAEGIATVLPRWASFLIVFGALVAVAGLLVWFGIKKVKRIKAPQTTIKTTRETVDYLKKSRG
jgi:hypothetical protein